MTDILGINFGRFYRIKALMVSCYAPLRQTDADGRQDWKSMLFKSKDESISIIHAKSKELSILDAKSKKQRLKISNRCRNANKKFCFIFH